MTQLAAAARNDANEKQSAKRHKNEMLCVHRLVVCLCLKAIKKKKNLY